MQNYFMPTKIVMGKGCITQSHRLLADFGKKALIVTGRHSAKANGALRDVTQALTANGQTYAVFDRVLSNPTVACAYEGAAFAQKNGVDFIVSIGGGSPMDAGKAIALLALQTIREEDLFSGMYGSAVLPIVAVPTTAGTGSEVTPYAILTNPAAQTKMSIATPSIFPRLALLDAGYMKDLPLDITLYTAIDALSHSVEGMLSRRANLFSDCLAAESIRRISACFPAFEAGVVDEPARESLLYASTLGGMTIANTGTTAVHAIGYSLTYFKNIEHGRANGLLLGRFLALAEGKCPARVRQILGYMGLPSTMALCSALETLMGRPASLTRQEMEQYISLAMRTKNIANGLFVPSPAELKAVLEESM